jgi:hypothetical protein
MCAPTRVYDRRDRREEKSIHPDPLPRVFQVLDRVMPAGDPSTASRRQMDDPVVPRAPPGVWWMRRSRRSATGRHGGGAGGRGRVSSGARDRDGGSYWRIRFRDAVATACRSTPCSGTTALGARFEQMPLLKGRTDLFNMLEEIYMTRCSGTGLIPAT